MDKKRKAKIVDAKKFAKAFAQEIVTFEEKFVNNKTKKKGIVLDSHLAHYVSPKSADYCIITTCSLKTLQNRLQKRKYSWEKVRENLDAEIFDICLVEAEENDHTIIKVDTSKPYLKKLLKKL